MKVEKITLVGDRELYVNVSSHFDETKPAAYLVEYSCGHYDTYVNGPVCVYHKLDDAVAFLQKHYQWKDDIERLAIKNLYNSFGDYNSEIEDEPNFPNCEQYPFDKIKEDWREYCFKQMFPNKTWNDVTPDEEEQFFELSENDDKFVQWMVSERGLTKEVAHASIIYNNSDEHSEFGTNYSITKINII